MGELNMSTPGKAKMAISDKSLIGWKPRKWVKEGRRLYNGNGRRKPRGKKFTRSASAMRRKRRNAAQRKAARRA